MRTHLGGLRHIIAKIVVMALLFFPMRLWGQAEAGDVNAIPVHAERLARLLGSYLTAIADPSTPETTKATYRTAAKKLFTPGATIEVSSKYRKQTTTMTIDEYLDVHFEELVSKRHYQKIILTWKVKEVSTLSPENSLFCLVDQDFDASNESGQTAYSDLTEKKLKLVVKPVGIPIGGGRRLEFNGLQLEWIKVMKTSGKAKFEAI